MKVSELIEFLQTQPQHLTVIYPCCSEYTILDKEDISIERLCSARDDGWVQKRRLDKQPQDYLILPGN